MDFALKESWGIRGHETERRKSSRFFCHTERLEKLKTTPEKEKR